MSQSCDSPRAAVTDSDDVQEAAVTDLVKSPEVTTESKFFNSLFLC